ncbi:MAG: GDP-4-dehydro-6-deoxy-D-mannose reductase, partial [Acidimicrobiaceae bacterium]|nr:GDP-4-dehydro-6-deoxy-D-mannose reductase [Acidimicrobiaceae bacterium]
AFRVNAEGSLCVLEAARACARLPRVLLVGSSEVYGQVSAERMPIGEDSPLRPVTPYAASKAAAEMVGLQAFLAHDLGVIRVRPFNHVGPGQAPTFVVSSLARNVAEAERDGTGKVVVGNLSPRRDFTDVRDVVAAYRGLIVDGEAGEVYNVCSGRDIAIDDIAHRLLALAKADLTLEVDRSRFRPVDVPVVRGDPSRLQATTGWEPAIPLDDTLRDTLDYWRAHP